jgi:hypothetical protein
MLICCLPAEPPESTKRIHAALSGLHGKGRRSDPVRANSVADMVGIDLKYQHRADGGGSAESR